MSDLTAATLILGGLILGAIGILWSIHITLCRVRNQLAVLIHRITKPSMWAGRL